jgi:hypothetical protein
MSAKARAACFLGLALFATACGDLLLDLSVPDAATPVTPDAENADGAPQVPRCAMQSDCTEGGTPLCDTEAGVCVECLTSNDCSGNTPHCLNGTCVSCTTSADCSQGMVCNMHIPRCATECTDGTECSGKPCATAYGYCVECLSNVDCTDTSLPYCFEPPAYGVCVACFTDADCHHGQICGPMHLCS